MPSFSFLILVSTLPLISLHSISGLMFLIWNSLLNDEVPITDFKFNSLSFFLSAVIKISLGSFLSKKVSVLRPFDSIAGKSFNAWTAISIFLLKSSFSILLENNPFPPTSDSLVSWTWSPFVIIDLTVISLSLRSVFFTISSLAFWA